MDEFTVADGVHRDHRRIAQQATEVDLIADFCAWYWDDAHRGGLVVHHADGCFICDHAGDGLGRGSSWQSDHIEANRTDCRHRFQLVHADAARTHSVNHAFVLGNRDEGTRQSADARARHHATLFHGVVEQCQRRGGSMRSHLIEAHVFQNVCDTVAQFRGRRQ